MDEAISDIVRTMVTNDQNLSMLNSISEEDEEVQETRAMGMYYGCKNGSNILRFYVYKCGNKYYKCPGYYCIPWKYVCNQVWDCPEGIEEIGCSERQSCPGQFKCDNSIICVTLHSLCDEETDCPLGDDELFCENVPKCLESCKCVHHKDICNDHVECPLYDDEANCDHVTCHKQCTCINSAVFCRNDSILHIMPTIAFAKFVTLNFGKCFKVLIHECIPVHAVVLYLLGQYFSRITIQ